MKTTNWLEEHPFVVALLITAAVGFSVRFPWWSSWHHWWVAPEAYLRHLAHIVRTAWDHPMRTK